MSEEEVKEEIKTEEEEEEKDSETTPPAVERTPTPPPLTILAEEKHSEKITESAKEVSEQDVLVCGKCHKVYYFLEGFQEHKKNEKCEENDELKETLKDEKKPQIWAFTLWKNTKFKDRKEEEEGAAEKDPTSWSLYQKWCNLEDKEKESWIKAGENIQALFEITTAFEQAKHTINEVKIQEKVESEDHSMDSVKDEKDPLGDDSDQETVQEKGKNKKAILKPVQLNNKATANKKPKTYRKAVKTTGDPNVELPVEKIVAKRYNPRRKTFEYLIKWEDFDAEKNSWEPVASLEPCKVMVEEFEKHWQNHKAQLKLQKSLEKKMPKKQNQEIVQLTPGGRPQRTSKQKAMNQVKQWCGNMEADENSSNKRVFSDDSDDDDAFEKRMKYEEYSSDSENDSPLVTIKRIQKSQNGVEKKKIEKISLPENILIPDSKGIVRINQKQIPSLSSGVYVMSKTAGIIKLDTKASKLATSCGQTLLKVAPKIGQTSIKVIKKEVTNGSTMSKTANILRKPPLRNYSGRVYMQKKQNTQQQQLAAAAKKVSAEVVTADKEDEESDGVEELEFPTDLPIPAPDSPPAAFTLCPLTGKVLDKNGDPIEPDPPVKEEPQTSNNDNTVALDNLVKLAAADILKDLTDDSKLEKESDIINSNEALTETPMDIGVKKELHDSDIAMHIDKPSVQSTSMDSKPKTSDSILSTALTNANITSVRRVSSGPVHRTQSQKTILNRTMGQRSAPQAIITRITPGSNSMQRSRVMAPKQKSDAPIIRKRIIHSNSNSMGNRSLVRKIGDTKVYPSSVTNQVQLQQVVTTFVATPTSENTVISMPSLVDNESVPILMTTEKLHQQAVEIKEQCEEELMKKEVQMEEPVVPTASADTLSQLTLAETETPLLITGEDGTIYQVAGQNEEGQTILITQGEDGEQQCLLVAPENAGLINQALMKSDEEAVAIAESEVDNPPTVSIQEPLEITTEAEESTTDDSQVVAQIVSANPPSPGGTRKVVLMLPDGNFMMTEVTAEQYAALELDK